MVIEKLFKINPYLKLVINNAKPGKFSAKSYSQSRVRNNFVSYINDYTIVKT